MVGCYHPRVLVPAPSAQKEGDFSASAREKGVQVTAQGDWEGEPSTLSEVVTPIQIAIHNHSENPLVLRYQEFSLRAGNDGFVSSAIPPFQVNRPGVMAVNPAFPYSNFYLAPQYTPFYPSLTPWPRDFAWGPYAYDSYATAWQAALPTNDMLQKALPEGVLDKRGSITGFVYFQRLNFPVGTPAYFSLNLINANDGKKFGTVTIPFLIERK
jgi:hypothetical protein